MKKKAICSVVVMVAATALTGCGSGDDVAAYPDGGITVVIPYAPGGSTDPLARQYAAGLEDELGVTVTVQNRPGGSATIGTSEVVTADPDGYTIGLSSSSALAYQPTVNEDLPYGSPDDYEIITKLVDIPAVLAVQEDAPWDTLSEFLEHVEANPGEVKVSTSGAMTTADIVMQEVNRTAGLEIDSVPFSGGGGEATTALLGGRVDATAGFAAGILGFVDAGDLKVIGVFDDEPYPVFPDAQTSVDAGLEVTLPTSYYMIAPNGLPAPVLERLHTATESLAKEDEFKSFIENNGYILDVKSHDDAASELRQYREQYEVLNEYLGL